jgi:hypothetical protein
MRPAIHSVSGLVMLLAVSGASGQTAPAAPASATPTATAPASAPNVVRTETERKGRSGLEIFLGTYLTLNRECKVGPTPKIEYPEPPKNGKMTTRAFPINLRAVPGAPRGNCIGTSPNGLAVIYRSERRFRGEDRIVFRVVYPTGDVREVTARVIVQ